MRASATTLDYYLLRPADGAGEVTGLVVEEFVLTERAGGTELTYRGELGTDLGPAGRRWGDLVARRWEHVVAETLDAVRTEAERRARK